MEEEILARGLDILITATGCMKLCEKGPIMVVQPDNWWFGGVSSEEAIDAILRDRSGRALRRVPSGLGFD